MAKVTLTDAASGYALNTTINANNTALEDAIEKQLSRDGTSPNQMEASLDMNGNRLTNLPDATNNTEPLTLGQAATLSELTGITATAGAVGEVLYERTTTEISEGVTPENYQYPEGNILRYGTNTTPGTTDMTTALQTAFDVIKAKGGGDVIIPAGDYAITSVSVTWSGLDGADVTSVNVRGQGKTASILRKIGATTTPMIDLIAINVQTPNFVFSDFEMIGNSKAHHGIRATLLARLTFQRVSIYVCDIAFYSRGTQFVTFEDCTLTANNVGYESIEWTSDATASDVQPNAVGFYGGEIRNNSDWGVQIRHGDLTTFYQVNFERNGVASDNTTGAFVVRGTIDDKTSTPTVELQNCWFEENRGGRVIYAEASNLSLILRNTHMFGITADNNNISVDAIRLFVLDNYSVNGGGEAVESNAVSTIIIGGQLGTYTDNSTTTYLEGGSTYTSSISATGAIEDIGQSGTFAFLSASSGLANVGAYNYDTASTEPLNLFCTHVQFPTYTDTELNDITDAVNTDTGKVEGAMVFNSTQNVPCWAVGNTDGAVWVNGAGTTVNTPV